MNRGAALPWEPQPGESAKAYDGFRRYVEMPPPERSFDRAWESYSGRPLPAGRRAPGHWNKWTRLNSWASRAAAWDAERARQHRDAELAAEREAIAEMRKRHIRVATELQAIAGEEVERLRARQLATRAREGDQANATLTPYQLARLLRESVAIERLARGEPETIIGERDQPEGLAEPTEDETRALLLRILNDPEALDLAQRLALALDQ